jgi:hypothetical protein
MTTPRGHRYRAFICYAHGSEGTAADVKLALEKLGVTAWIDQKIKGGRDFRNQIEAAILSAHFFVPVLTPGAEDRDWVQQEIGFAVALNVPVLAVSVGKENVPGGMIGQRQAIVVPAGASVRDLTKAFRAADIPELIEHTGFSKRMLMEVVHEPEDRPTVLKAYLDQSRELHGYAFIRHKAYYGTFSIPVDRNIGSSIWKQREHGWNRQAGYLRKQWEERNALAEHARKKGCRLIIDPRPRLWPGDKTGWRARLKVLRAFVSGMPDSKIEVVPGQLKDCHNQLIAGSVFMAEADSRVVGQGYPRTHLTRHAPTVLRETREFDEEFEAACDRHRISAGESKAYTIKVLDRLLAGHR